MLKAVVSALVVAAAVVVPAGAVTTNGFFDDGQHPNVGAIMVPTRSGTGYAEVCSGTLVSPTVFVTASHCTSFVESLGRPSYVTFDETEIEPSPSGLIPAVPLPMTTTSCSP